MQHFLAVEKPAFGAAGLQASAPAPGCSAHRHQSIPVQQGRKYPEAHCCTHQNQTEAEIYLLLSLWLHYSECVLVRAKDPRNKLTISASSQT